MKRGKRRLAIVLGLGSALLLALGGVSLILGSGELTAGEAFVGLVARLRGLDGGIAATILFELRLPRIVLATLVGAALALSGTAFQGLFRNPLADPYVIGASSAAAFGAAIAMVLGMPAIGLLDPVAILALGGAFGAALLAFAIAQAAGNPPPATALILAGSALSAFFSALLGLLLVLHDQDLHRVYYWMLGSFATAGWQDVARMAPLLSVSVLLILLATRPLDLLGSGEAAAASLGLNVPRARLVIALAASLATACSVAGVGVVGFVGLVAPHVARLLVGPAHRRLLPASALIGAALLLASDLAARTLAAPLELPVGLVTSALGAPFFIYLLMRKGRSLGANP